MFSFVFIGVKFIFVKLGKKKTKKGQARVWASFGRCRVWTPRISVDLPKTPQGRLRENLERELGLNTDPPPRVDLEDIGAAADQLLQMEYRDVQFQTPALKSAANVV